MSAAEAARSVLAGNRRSGHSPSLDLGYDYTCPSPETYPFQWSWDSSYHAISLTHVDHDRARTELRSLLRAADPGGFVPHMVLWQDDLRVRVTEDFRIAVWDDWRTPTIAPPVLARAVERVYRATGDQEWLAEVLPATIRLFDWFARWRTGLDGLVMIFQPDESGLDMSPKYDAALGLDATARHTVAKQWHESMAVLIDGYGMRRDPRADLRSRNRFVWCDVLVNTIYADGLRCLARLVPEESERFDRRAAGITDALLRHCWDERRGVFWDLDGVTGQRAEVLTASSLFPLVLPDLPDDVVRGLVDDHLLNEAEFWLPHPVPSVAASEPSFDPDFGTKAIFRGSSWVNLNWYLYWGLREHGREDVAAELAARTVAMTAGSGMRECYGPFDAEGHGARQFGWSSLVLDLIHAEGMRA